MRVIGLLAALWFIVGCGNTASDGDSATPAFAATSEERTFQAQLAASERRFPRRAWHSDDYYAIKLAAALQFATTRDGRFADPDLEDRYETFVDYDFSIWGCGEAFGVVWSAVEGEEGIEDVESYATVDPRGRELLLQDIAHRAVALQIMLARDGFPEARIAGPIEQWERAELAAFDARIDPEIGEYPGDYFGTGEIYDPEMTENDHRLMVTLNREVEAGLLPPEGCGAGDFAYVIETRPSGAEATIIRSFDFEACRVRGIDPYDRERCRGWRNVSDGQQALLSGNYRYLIAPGGGRRQVGAFTAQRTTEAQEGIETITLGAGAR